MYKPRSRPRMSEKRERAFLPIDQRDAAVYSALEATAERAKKLAEAIENDGVPGLIDGEDSLVHNIEAVRRVGR